MVVKAICFPLILVERICFDDYSWGLLCIYPNVDTALKYFTLYPLDMNDHVHVNMQLRPKILKPLNVFHLKGNISEVLALRQMSLQE